MNYFIIPAYQAEKSLEKAFYSVPDSDENHVIVIVDSNSEDCTLDVAKKIVSSKREKIVLYGKFGSAAATRNMGLKWLYNKAVIQKCDKLIFLDADDYFDTTNLQRELELSKCEIESIFVYLNNQNKSVQRQVHEVGYEKAVELSLHTTDKLEYSPEIRFNSVWGKIFPMELFYKQKFLFDENLKIGEDLIAMINLYGVCKHIVTISSNTYWYVENRESSVHSFQRNFLVEDRYFHSELVNFLEVHPEFKSETAFKIIRISKMRSVVNMCTLFFFAKGSNARKSEWQNAKKEYKYSWKNLIDYRDFFQTKQLVLLFLYKATNYNFNFFKAIFTII